MCQGLRYLVLISLCGCAQPAKEHTENSDLFDQAVSSGIIQGKEIREASGLAASVRNPGMFWTHNDSGNKAEIFLFDKQGTIHCTVHMGNVKNRDWEEIAVNTINGKSYLYIGEIGDNNAAFEYKYLYRIEEPIISTGISDTTITSVDEIKFKLPDGPRDTEAFILDPATQDVYIFSKREQNVNLYRLKSPLTTEETMIAERVVKDLPFTLIVAADISKDGTEILAKNYTNVFYWKRTANETIEDALTRPAQLLPYIPEPQGEAIAFDPTGVGYYTISEQKKKMPQHLFFYKRNND